MKTLNLPAPLPNWLKNRALVFYMSEGVTTTNTKRPTSGSSTYYLFLLMSYEFNSLDELTAALESIGSTMFTDGYFTETYADDNGMDFYGTGGNDISFDSMSTFDSDDYEYAQSMMY